MSEPASRDFTIRPAIEADAPTIGAVHVATWRSAYRGLVHDAYLSRLDPADSAEALLTAIQDSSVNVFVAEVAGKVVGFIELRESPKHAVADGQVQAIYLLQEYQGRKIGRALLDAAFEQSRHREFKTVFVSVLSDNKQAVAFYQRSGARLIGSDHVILDGIRYETDTLCWMLT